jgi:CheW-like domain
VQAALTVSTSSQLAQAAAQVATAAATYQAFRVASVWCYTGFDEASELVDPLAATWLPNTPAWFMGLAHLNGYVVPVIDWAPSLLENGNSQAGSVQKPLFHLLFGRRQQRLAVAIHTLPFTVTVAIPAQAPLRGDQSSHLQALTPALAQVVDAALPWSQVSHTAQGSVALASGAQMPQVLHHLSAVLLADWFARNLHG